MTDGPTQEQLGSLFATDERGIFTYAAGYSHARFDQYTALARHVHEQMLGLLDHCGIEYFLFAGSMVGYVRNRSMPYWMDDLDIIIFDDQIQAYEEVALPLFAECGFNCFYQDHLKGGGYHMLSMQQGESRRLTIPLTDTKRVSVPWAQIDVFYTVVDANGIVRNPANWGIYHTRDIPLDWVKPGRIVDIDGLKARVFQEYEADIRKEYGDVCNHVVVRNHSTVFLNAPGIPWERFEVAFKRHLAHTSMVLPDTITPIDLAHFRPVEGRLYRTGADESLASICANVVRTSAERVHLTDGELIFWAMDLKRLFPALGIDVTAGTVLQAQRAAHLRAFIDRVDCFDEGVKSEYDRCVSKLRSLLDQ